MGGLTDPILVRQIKEQMDILAPFEPRGFSFPENNQGSQSVLLNRCSFVSTTTHHCFLEHHARGANSDPSSLDGVACEFHRVTFIP